MGEVKIPDVIYLQWYGDDHNDEGPVDTPDVTWCVERINNNDIAYTRKPQLSVDVVKLKLQQMLVPGAEEKAKVIIEALNMQDEYLQAFQAQEGKQ